MRETLLVAFLAGSILLGSLPAVADEYAARVIGVSDGDTVSVRPADGSALETVRLSDIDCPEKKQAFGTRAKQFTADKVFGKTVTVQTTGRDRYGRKIGKIVLPDGSTLNTELVKSGYAWWFGKYSKDALIKEAEERARGQKIGLWAETNPIPPWEFRAVKRSTEKKKSKTNSRTNSAVNHQRM